MDFIKKLNLKPGTILKISGLVLIGIILVTFAFLLVSSSFSTLRKGISDSSFGMAPSSITQMYKSSDMAYGAEEAVGLSTRNVSGEVIPPSHPDYASGDDAEEYEVKEYDATIETRNLENTCQAVAGLKAKDYVVFENSSEYDKGCNYTFKVKKEMVDEILGVINELDPKELTENTYTIKRLIEDFTSEIEILEKKKESIDDTLESAIKSYNEISDLATRTRDAETLAKIIDSKIKIIERLTQERINISAQLERLARSKAEQLDRLDYTYFYVYIYESKYIDGENLKDSWKQAIKEFVLDINKAIQGITINLISVLFIILQYLIYLFILLLIAKYGWRLVKYIWKR
ncbi:MAG: hypothetical protein ABIE43_05555 [Patescibacteria group bacterium]